MKSKVLILDTRQLPYSLLHVMSKVLIVIIISNIDKDTGLTVIPVVIVSNQTVHSHAMSCLLISSRIIFQVLKKYIFGVMDVAASLDHSMLFAYFLSFPEI